MPLMLPSIQQNAKLNRRKMRVYELLPLQSFLWWIKRKLPSFFSIFLPGKANDDFHDGSVGLKFTLQLLMCEVRVYRNDRSWWRRLVSFVIDQDDDLRMQVKLSMELIDVDLEQDEELEAENLTEIEELQQDNARLQTEVHKLEDRVLTLQQTFQEQSKFISILAKGRAAANLTQTLMFVLVHGIQVDFDGPEELL